MFYTYVLSCRKGNKKELYVGSTSNLKQRFNDHLSKSVGTTKKYTDIFLVYYEACNNKTDAIRREKQLKTGFGRGYIKRRLYNDVIMRD